MGRKRTKNLNLPEGMLARTQRSGKVYYYLASRDESGKRGELALGANFIDALKQYCELVKMDDKPCYSWLEVVKRYQVKCLPTKAIKTQADEISRLKRLNKFFEEVTDIDLIEAKHLRLYQEWRLKTKSDDEALRRKEGKPASRKGDGKVAVNRELTLFSTIWKFARVSEYTKQDCPAELVTRYKETGRKDIYTEDEVLEAVYNAGDQALKDALDLAYLTGQRRADVLAMTETQIRVAKYRQPDGSVIEVDTVPVKQEKTGNKVRMIIDGDLAKLIERIRASKKARKVVNISHVISKSLLVTEDGDKFTMQMLRGRFEKARKLAAEAADEAGALDLGKEIRDFQFRDLRAKAGSDKAEETGSMIEAQKMLGHSAASTTETYVRHRRGALVKPTR